MKIEKGYRVGVDIGSTTIKVIALNKAGSVIYRSYRRHKADIDNIFKEELLSVSEALKSPDFIMTITGSAGMGVAERSGIRFVQEVIASVEVIKRVYPEVSTMIDIGGEDTKLVLFNSERQPDIKMNGSCAGGTGAFIDQMADLMNMTVEELSDRASGYEKIYPVASRCGVFAKTDIQSLISRNIPTADIAISIFHAVALQCITTLAKGCDIKPKVLCTGGPLTFIPVLRDLLGKLLGLDDDELFLPENSEYFAAWGSALCCEERQADCNISHIIDKMGLGRERVSESLPPVFRGREEYSEWIGSRKVKELKKREIGVQEDVRCFLGIDSGSTTTKIVVTDSRDNILFTYYSLNEGNPLKKVYEGLAKFYSEVTDNGATLRFLSSASTGYGEDLVKSALGLDHGIVETMAHLTGAQYVEPDVSFILDIGGQDMKSIFVNKGTISAIELNEACSSGCGSFLQNFASALNMSMEEFTNAAALAKHPGDLGSRCTVFMNSKVKQLLRENASPGDIAAGLAYSVVKNCLFKVLKISNLDKLGSKIVVQGGTFRNDAVYRTFELLSGKSVSSASDPELMGAFGAALYAKKMYELNGDKTDFTGTETIPDINDIHTEELQCKGCNNRCPVLRFRFSNGNSYYAGNKCEKIFHNSGASAVKGIDFFDTKNELLFNRQTVGTAVERSIVKNKGIKIGIPRVLNMFENYPFWHTLFTESGLEVVLSPESTISLYQSGVGGVMSDNICFPAKLVHGHILKLAESRVDRIFYPMVVKEEKEHSHANNSYNCPVVSGYPDVILSSTDPVERYGIPLDKPVINLDDHKSLYKACSVYLASLGIERVVSDMAFKAAIAEYERTKKEIIDNQLLILQDAIAKKELLFIVAGRPYHADPLIHQKVGQILSDMGVHVLSDDIFRKEKEEGFTDLTIVSQWSYPNRVVQAAIEVAKLPPNIQMIQLNSFGCGPDSFFMDEIGSILANGGKSHTILRLDEIASPGAIKLRIRSLIESLKASNIQIKGDITTYKGYDRRYTKEERKKTILAPWFSDFISPFFPAIAGLAGYKLVNLPPSVKKSAEIGLKYGHNEVCYPSTLVLGDIIMALQSGRYDSDDIVIGITQTGGQCRATNYVSQIKSGLRNAGFGDTPVVVISTGEVYQNEQEAFNIPVLKLMNITVYALLYADAIQQMYSSIVIRELNSGDARSLFEKYIEQGVDAVAKNEVKTLLKSLKQAVADFNAVDISDKEFPKVGLVGEIYVKYNNYGQGYMTDWMQAKGIEVVTPPALDFIMQYFVNSKVNRQNGMSRDSLLKRYMVPVLQRYMNRRITEVEHIAERFRFYRASESIYTKAEYAAEVLDLSNQFGEGWLIAADIACFARTNINRVVCIQPFGCIANHIVGKGIEKRIKKLYPATSLLYLDLDDGTASVNLQNRLHFLIS